MIVRILAFLIVALLAALPARALELERADLSITTTGGQAYHFNVEVAKTAEEQNRGLMFRRSMPADAGMIFPFDRDTTTNFWMKNTLIPLDMLFVAGDGRISHIVANATPLSVAEIPSGGPIRMVVELNGGTTARFGIHVGDHVSVGPLQPS